MTIPFIEQPRFLRGALDIERPEVPSHLLNAVRAVIPITGWAQARWVGAEVVVPAAGAAGAVTLLDLSAQPRILQGLVCAFSVHHAGGAGAALIRVELLDPVIATNIIEIANASPGVDLTARHRDFFASVNDWPFCPPGFQLRIEHPATAVGETFTVRFISATMPAGTQIRS